MFLPAVRFAAGATPTLGIRLVALRPVPRVARDPPRRVLRLKEVLLQLRLELLQAAASPA